MLILHENEIQIISFLIFLIHILKNLQQNYLLGLMNISLEIIL